jgi:tetratricopeptide (TPR) repeat protein
VQARARVRAEQLFEAASAARGDRELFRQLSLGSAALLELSGVSDAEGRVLLGRVLLDAEAGREREAMQLITSSLPNLPVSDFKRDSLFDLGLGAMLNGDYVLAERAFSQALALAWNSDFRASIHRNRGKARMLGGDARGSVADFRAAVRLARGTEVLALSYFGLGVALERSGDFPQGLAEVARGAAIRMPSPPYASESVLDLPSLRWVPEYDVHYFRALSYMARESQQSERADRAESFALALESWNQYLPAALARADRFAANAERHRKRCQEALSELSKLQR